MQDGCKSLLIYADSLHEYFIFLTPEASTVLDEYLQSRRERGEKLTPESYVIGREPFIVNEKRPKPVMINSFESSLSHAMRRAGISRIKKGNRYDVAVCGSFRKRFNTILKKNPNISFTTTEIMMDHSVKQEPSYNKPTKEELFDEYKKAIPELTIDDSLRKQLELDRVNKEKSKLEKNNDTIKQLEKKYDVTINAFKEFLNDSIDHPRVVHGDQVYPTEKEIERRKHLNEIILKELEMLEP